MIAHAEAGELKGWHNEWREIQVGTKTTIVPEKGHWEKRIVKPAWTEKKLVREAGWY
ncbi:unknown [Clostridium sp. CAG:964]|nr:unknown [Clostridium sp. CAG:964]